MVGPSAISVSTTPDNKKERWYKENSLVVLVAPVSLLFLGAAVATGQGGGEGDEWRGGGQLIMTYSWILTMHVAPTLCKHFELLKICWSRKMQQKRVHMSACGHTHVCEGAVCVCDWVHVWCWWAARSGNKDNDLESQVKKQMYVCEHVPQAERPSDAMWEPKVSIVPHLKWMRVDKVDSVRMSAEDLSNGQKLPRW
jgi:hypothetical protein